MYSLDDLHKLLGNADLKLKTMIMLALNCGFGPKDLQDLTWDDILGERITLPRSKTDVWQTYLLWPETKKLLTGIRKQRAMLVKERMTILPEKSLSGCRKLDFSRQTRDSVENATRQRS